MILMKMIMTYGKKNWHIVDDVERYRHIILKKVMGMITLYLACKKKRKLVF